MGGASSRSASCEIAGAQAVVRADGRLRRLTPSIRKGHTQVLYWWSKFVLLGPLLRLLCRPTIEGVEHVPANGGAILASNHLAVVDSFFLPLLVPRRITFLAKREYFTQPGLVAG